MNQNNNITNLLENLLKEENVENNLISLYLILLNFGIENCISESQREGFRKGMAILYNDSVKHKEIINIMFNKYKLYNK